jgi:anti-sigma factor (TIGR02949 family)
MTLLNFEKKECERVRRRLDAYLSNELLVETADEVLRHLEACPECSKDLETRMRVRQALQVAVMRAEAPAHLRDRIHRALRAGQPEVERRLWIRWAAGAAFMALLIVGWLGTRQRLEFHANTTALTGALGLGVQDHIHCALQAKNYPAVPPTPGEMQSKLGPRYSGLVPIVMAELPGFRILDGHICHIPGSPRKYMHFITKRAGTILSVVLTRKEGESLAHNKSMAAQTVSGMSLDKARLQGMDVAGFETQEYLGFVVSDIGQQEVVSIAASLAPGMRNLLQSAERAGLRGTSSTMEPSAAFTRRSSDRSRLAQSNVGAAPGF